MSTVLALAAGAVRTWVSLYTFGLPGQVRADRRSEIDSDLWEHQRFAEHAGDSRVTAAAQIVTRTLLGILSDVSWRVQAGLRARSNRRVSMPESRLARGLFIAALVIASLPTAAGVSVIFGGDFESTGQRVYFSSVSILAGLLMASGLLLADRRPTLALALIGLGIIVLASTWYWMAVITVPVGIALAAVAFFRARRTGWPRRSDAT